jgi:hypothetical protein
MRPIARPPFNSRTSTLPRRKRANVTVSWGTADRDSGTTGTCSASGTQAWVLMAIEVSSRQAQRRGGDANLRNYSAHGLL